MTLPPCKLIWGQRWTSHSSNAIYKDSIKKLMLSFALAANVCVNTITHLLVKHFNYNEFMHLANALVWMQFGTNMLVIQIKCYLIQIQWMQLIQNIIHLNPYINKSTDFLNDHFKLDRSPYVLICRGSCLHYLGVRKVKCVVQLEGLLGGGYEGQCGCQSKETVQLLFCEHWQMFIFRILLFFKGFSVNIIKLYE